MLKKIAIGLTVVVLVIVGLAMTKPDTFHVERSIVINAPPERVHALVNDYHHWGTWSPWEKLDPAMQRTYSGADSGVGAAYAWSGNSKVGSGRMEITESSTPSLVAMKLDFTAPMEASNTSRFDFVPTAEGTRVTWAMDGPCNFVSKVMQVFVSMDRLVGGDFEQGLANMKAEAEKQG